MKTPITFTFRTTTQKAAPRKSPSKAITKSEIAAIVTKAVADLRKPRTATSTATSRAVAQKAVSYDDLNPAQRSVIDAARALTPGPKPPPCGIAELRKFANDPSLQPGTPEAITAEMRRGRAFRAGKLNQ